MPLISVTRLRLRSHRFLLPFIWYVATSALQVKKTPGNLGIRLRKTKSLTFWTLTIWENDQTMKAFRKASPHREAMSRLPHWCDEASVAHWEQDSKELPSWVYASEQLSRLGSLSKVLYPSESQKAGVVSTS